MIHGLLEVGHINKAYISKLNKSFESLIAGTSFLLPVWSVRHRPDNKNLK